MGCNIKKYVLLLCEMVKVEEIKDMPKGFVGFARNHDHLQEIIMKDYGRLLWLTLDTM